MQFLNDRKGISACQLQRDMGVTYKTAWRMLQQLRIAANNRETELLFDIVIEVDETYAGGKPGKGNTILDKDGNIIARTKSKNKRGRGTKKIQVAGAKGRNTGQVFAKVTLPDEKGQRQTSK